MWAFPLLLILAAAQSSCKEKFISSDEIPDAIPDVIPTTKASGSGGTAYMQGMLRDYISPNKSATNTQMLILNHKNYGDTLLNVFITSTDGSFRFIDLPVDTVDLIFLSDSFLSAKIAGLLLRENENSFYNPYGTGFFQDNIVFLIATKDSIERPNAPKIGIIGYGPTVVIKFKPEVTDSVALSLVGQFPNDTLIVYPPSSITPEVGITCLIIYDRGNQRRSCFLVQERLRYFNSMKEVWYSGGSLTFIQP